MWHNSFSPIIDKNSKVLILGSFPSVKSRQVGFYYGNPQNRFWGVLSEFFGEQIPSDVEGRKAFVLTHGVALWDVVDKSNISGSSDSAIDGKSSTFVDVKSLINEYDIKLIILNGKKAYNIFTEIYPDCQIEYLYLPSTSPANVSFDKNKWLDALNKVF